MLIKVITFYLVFLIGISLEKEVKNELVQSVIKVFQMKHPVILTPNNTLSSRSLMKDLFSMGQFCQFGTEVLFQNLSKDVSKDIIIIADKDEYILEDVLEISNTAVIFSRNFEYQKATSIGIDKKVFIIEELTNDVTEVFETYHINSRNIKRKLGRFKENIFSWENNVEKVFVSRRSDFQGLTLTTMTQDAGNDIIFDSDYTEKAINFLNNQTYLVTNFTQGKFYDILISLQNLLNFTSNLNKRKDNGWGFVYPQANGSFHATGMVGDLFFGRADLIVTSLSVLYQRALYIDYLIPIAPDTLGLFIPSGHSKGEFQFNVFLLPFRYILHLSYYLKTKIIQYYILKI